MSAKSKSAGSASEKGNEKAKPKVPKLLISSEVKPLYVNLARIAHSPSELVFDFAHLLPGEKNGRVVSRILMSPLSAKLLHRALSENLAKFETAYGEIKIPKKHSLADHLFRPLQPPEEPDEE